MKRALGALIIPAALLATACGSNTTTPSTSPSVSGGQSSSGVALTAKNVSGLGTVLVNAQGRTLYVFAPDKGKKVTCTAACQKVWPPLSVAAGQKPSVSGGLKASLVSSDANPAGGGQVVTYAGWPLYLYVADPTAGTAHGQALNSSGGLWYVITPSGTMIKKPVKSSSSGAPGY